jgi:hypothetical protein
MLQPRPSRGGLNAYDFQSIITSEALAKQLAKHPAPSVELIAASSALLCGESLWAAIRFAIAPKPNIRSYLGIDSEQLFRDFCSSSGFALTAMETIFSLSECYFNEWDESNHTTIPSPNGLGSRWAIASATEQTRRSGDQGIIWARLGNVMCKTVFGFLLAITGQGFTINEWRDSNAELPLTYQALNMQLQLIDDVPRILLV